nr:TPA_asm: hypothetical protein [Triaenopico virus 2]
MSSLESPGTGPVPEESVALRNTHGNSALKQHADSAMVTFEEMLQMETVLLSGSLDSTTLAGSIIYATEVCPTQLTSRSMSRVEYVANLFAQWCGEIQFKLYVTKAIFQQTKLLMVYVPGIRLAAAKKMSIEQLMGCQIRSVVNPSNDSEATISIPFISGMNWLACAQSTGVFQILTLQPIVVTQETSSVIPYTLCVSSPKSKGLKFRYAMMPSATTVSDGIPAQAQLLATSSTNRARGQAIRGQVQTLIVNSGMSELASLKYVLPIPKPQNAANVKLMAQKLCTMSLPSFFSFNARYYTGSFPSESVLLPDDNLNICQYPDKNGPYFFDNVLHTCPGDKASWFYIQRTNPVAEFMREFAGSLIAIGMSNTTLASSNLTFGGATSTHYWFTFTTEMWISTYFTIKTTGSSANNYRIQAVLEQSLTQMMMQETFTHFNLYVSGPITEWRNVKNYLDGTESKLSQFNISSAYSLSSSQAPDSFALLPDTQRGLFAFLFDLFGGSADSPWCKICRIADNVLDFCIPLIFGYTGDAAPLSIENGVALEYVSSAPILRELVITESPKTLIGLPEATAPKQIDFFEELIDELPHDAADTRSRSAKRHSRRRRAKAKLSALIHKK